MMQLIAIKKEGNLYYIRTRESSLIKRLFGFFDEYGLIVTTKSTPLLKGRKKELVLKWIDEFEKNSVPSIKKEGR